jgi:hypothetical protein
MFIPTSTVIDLNKLTTFELEKLLFDCQNALWDKELADKRFIEYHEVQETESYEESDKFCWER